MGLGLELGLGLGGVNFLEGCKVSCRVRISRPDFGVRARVRVTIIVGVKDSNFFEVCKVSCRVRISRNLAELPVVPEIWQPS